LTKLKHVPIFVPW